MQFKELLKVLPRNLLSCGVLQVIHNNVELLQRFSGAVVESVQQGMHPDASSQTAGFVPAAAGAGGGGHAGSLQPQGNSHGIGHSAAGLKQRASAARAQDGVQMTQLRAGADDE
jgi:hypothetical protein